MATSARMPNVFWLGGGCGAGKTTIARVLTRRLDLRLYPVDGYTYAHVERSKLGGFPLNRAIAEMTPEQRWAKTPSELAKLFAAGSAQRLEMIVADLRDLVHGPTVRQQVQRHSLMAADVDGERSLADTIDMVAQRLESLPGGLVRAAGGEQRRRTRQAENAIVVGQLLGWQSDMGPERMPDAPLFPFSCECESRGCEQTVTMSVAEYQRRSASGPVT